MTLNARKLHYLSRNPYKLIQLTNTAYFRLLNNQWAFDTAKQNVEKYYQVVGVLEELNTTLDVLEDQIPQFFKRAKITYEQHLLGKHSLV